MTELDECDTPGRPWLAVTVIAVALAAGLGTPWFLDFDEAVYAEVSRGMLASGDWVRPSWNGRPFYEKPALFYWLTAAGFSVAGVTPGVPRLISLLATLGCLALIGAEARRRFSCAAAEVAVWVAGASLLPFSLGRLGLLDALLTASLTAALLCFCRGLEERDAAPRRRWLALGYLASGIALAVKGPAFPLLIGGILLADALLRRDLVGTLRRSGLLWGVPLLALAGAPWYVLAYLADGATASAALFGKHHLQRVLSPIQGHGGPLWFYLPVLALALLPFTALLPRAIPALRAGDEAARRFARFCLVWAVVVVLAFSLAATKMAQYVAPAVPALALLLGAGLAARQQRPSRVAWFLTVGACLAFAGFVAALPFVIERAVELFGLRVLKTAPGLACLPPAPWPRFALLLPAAVLAGGGLAAWRAARRRGSLAAVRLLGITGALAWAGVWISLGHLLQVTTIAPLVRLSRQAAAELPSGVPIYLLQLNHRVAPNLATGRTVEFLSARTAEDRGRVQAVLGGGAPVRLIVPAAWWEELRGSLGGRELARDCGHVLVGESPPPARP
ncbi:MAG: phospholipid carrier-dependent glycosyltransferase [Acidobacteriota bacterium]